VPSLPERGELLAYTCTCMIGGCLKFYFNWQGRDNFLLTDIVENVGYSGALKPCNRDNIARYRGGHFYLVAAVS